MFKHPKHPPSYGVALHPVYWRLRCRNRRRRRRRHRNEVRRRQSASSTTTTATGDAPLSRSRRAATARTERLWDHGVIPYEIEANFSGTFNRRHIDHTSDVRGYGYGYGPFSSNVFTCNGALAPPAERAPRWKVFTGFPLQLIFCEDNKIISYFTTASWGPSKTKTKSGGPVHVPSVPIG